MQRSKSNQATTQEQHNNKNETGKKSVLDNTGTHAEACAPPCWLQEKPI